MNFWSVPREWPSQTAFIIAGGPSVLNQDLELLRGRNVIVINSSVYAAPWANFLYFGDWRWWNEPENQFAVMNFRGRVVTVSRLVKDSKVLVCRVMSPPGLELQRDSLMQKHTSLTAATNLAVHLVGSGGTIVWLGADGRHASDGTTHHHKPHRFPQRSDCFDKQHTELMTIVPNLQALKISLFNASPGTAWADLAPIVRLEDTLSAQCAA
jgi:hypothetical protein